MSFSWWQVSLLILSMAHHVLSHPILWMGVQVIDNKNDDKDNSSFSTGFLLFHDTVMQCTLVLLDHSSLFKYPLD